MTAAPRSFSYEIDENDRIVDVDEAWIAFARENGYALDSREQVLGTELRQTIAGWMTGDLYDELFRRLRGQRGQAALRYRCDSPEQRRFLELQIGALPDAHLRFTSRLLETAPRRRVPILDPKVRRNGQWHVICSVCLKLRDADESWREIEEAIPDPYEEPEGGLPSLSYTVCPGCQVAMRRAVRDGGADS
jgi:hypothetical protein